MSDKKTMMIAGANGFMGKYLSRYFLEKGWRVFGLARRTKGLASGVEFLQWDGVTVETSWVEVLDKVDVLINLAGRTVNCRYNDKNKRQILDSREKSTRVLGDAVAACLSPPSLWMNASTATIYAGTREKAHTESEGIIGDGFSVEIAKSWEATFDEAEVNDSVRKITLRTAIVMGDERGTALDVLSGLARKYLGGKMGDGGQMVSWIDVNDLCRVVEWMIENESASGVYNVAAPKALTNAEMMKRVRERVGVRFGLPASEWMLKVGAFFMRTETELILKSRWVYPERLIEEGFVFTKEEF
jgi:uncharacterized protein (TIGR01777 family)